MMRSPAMNYPTWQNPGRDNSMLAHIANQAPRIPWDKFITEELRWRSGEHFALIGPTGQGKTTMLLNLLPLHPYVVVFATKPRDTTMDNLIASGYVRMERWRSLDPMYYPRRVLWPNAGTLDAQKMQNETFHDAFSRIYREGGWTVALDETWYLANTLSPKRVGFEDLGKDIKMYLLQGRSLGISLICATQRPAFIPLEVYDQSTHLMFWRDNDETNLRRISGIGWRSADLIKHIVSNLEMHQVLYVNTRTGRMLRTRCPNVVMGGNNGNAIGA